MCIVHAQMVHSVLVTHLGKSLKNVFLMDFWMGTFNLGVSGEIIFGVMYNKICFENQRFKFRGKIGSTFSLISGVMMLHIL